MSQKIYLTLTEKHTIICLNLNISITLNQYVHKTSFLNKSVLIYS